MAEEHVGLPENARRELKPGEKYVPMIKSGDDVAEVTFRSVFLGIIMCIIFSAAIAYLTLKIGTGLEAAIPIAILSVGISYMFKRRNTLLENVMIIAIGSTSGIITGGAVFVLPALYVMGLDQYTNTFQLFLIPFLGSVLGVMLLIPLRRYFVADMHGKFPFPEATATAEILVAGRKGGRDALVLVYTMLIGGVYDLFCVSLRAWRETFSTDIIGSCSILTNKFKVVFSNSTGAAITAMGYIIGIRYTLMMATGGILSSFVLVPMIAYFGDLGGGTTFAAMSAGDIYSKYARMIGIGSIFMAGILAIIKFIPIIYKSTVEGLGDVIRSRSKHGGERVAERTERDIPMTLVLFLTIVDLIVIWCYFRYSVLTGQSNPFVLASIGLVSTFLLTFLFNSVSAYAIATISTTPISGMTMLTLLITIIVMAKAGVTGKEGMVAALLVGGVVCTALSMSGSLITQLKISYWFGATPKKVQIANIFGSVIAAAVTASIMVLLAKVYGYAPSPEHPHPLPAPQANAMAAVIGSFMSTGAPWFLYAVGAVIAVLMEMLGVAPLAVGLGLYLPLEINFPLLVGATVSWLVGKTAKKDEVLEARYTERGTLVSSGLVAGGALIGVVTALIRWIEQEKNLHILPDLANDGYWGNWLGLGMVMLLCYYMFWDARRVKK
ncbi:MAG: oligopeptide transporter, OPT family [Deltaproteobacteria bacterium CG11_big_fil_rev_8_21_14_0_20_49_13]|nr:MAG: oligopeptide transporter, OPT family [Deltaproteobacteria bacterium CG11_big_fil_rev_8_21_14_0_20_49_13]